MFEIKREIPRCQNKEHSLEQLVKDEVTESLEQMVFKGWCLEL
jgi:hypothetical protein